MCFVYGRSDNDNKLARAITIIIMIVGRDNYDINRYQYYCCYKIVEIASKKPLF